MESQTGLPAQCPRCGKPGGLCICDAIIPVETLTRVLILQHPREPREPLGTARIAQLALPACRLKVGLSWRNLKAAWGEEADPKRWGVLYLGTRKQSQAGLAGGLPATVLAPKGSAVIKQPSLEGIVALDGSWEQAKTMWWRNPWLLKLNLIVLSPSHPSLYGKARREPRRESLSTLEAVALCLSQLEHQPEIEGRLLRPFQRLLERAG